MDTKSLISFLLANILLIICGAALDVGERCVASDGISSGNCSLVTDCGVAIREISQTNSHTLRRCGFMGLIEVVCCPNEDITHFRPLSPPSKNIKPSKGSERIAVKECSKIIETILPPLATHIIGGEEASSGEFPHMVALGFEEGRTINFNCGGSLISTNFVLTAAHCIDNINKIRPTIARLGVTELGTKMFNKTTDIRISSWLIHPNYTKPFKYNDIALLKLEHDATYTSVLAPVCLYSRDDDPVMKLTATGWGTTNSTRNIRSDKLLKATISIVDREDCSKSYTNWRKLPFEIVDSQICARDEEGIKDTCQGDSGGPLQAQTEKDGHYRLVGVTSFGRGCASSAAGVYTRVSSFLDWIEQEVWP